VRFFRIDPLTMTYSVVRKYMQQLPRVRKWEAGEDPDKAQALDTNGFIAALNAGDIDLDALDRQAEDARGEVDKGKMIAELTEVFGRVQVGG
jgi:hypothetical protein